LLLICLNPQQRFACHCSSFELKFAGEKAGSRGKRLVRPEDLLKDEDQTLVCQGVTIRKGTIGAFMQNAGIFSSPDRPAGERAAARKLLVDYARAIIAMDVVSPQDLLNDQVDTFVRHGVKIRKGILLCFFVNGATFSSPLDPEEQAAARKLLVEAAPALVALGMDRVMRWKDPEIQRILDQARAELFGKPGTEARS
jgi:hypothetical protein